MRRPVLLAILIAGPLLSQPGFEVASIKELPGPTGRHFITSSSGPRFACEACAISELIRYAYGLADYQVTFAAPLSQAERETRYDIVANAEAGTVPTKEVFRQLLQKLLADRFQLKVHRDQKEMPVYSLVIGPKGSKLKESAPGTDRRWSLGGKGRNYEVTLRNTSMEDIRSAIDNAFLDRPVVDKTGLTGTYDATLTYTPNLRSLQADPDPGDISIFTAVQLDLGLKLSPEKSMVDVLIVDHVTKPSAN
jgi:uncharacterized protein (TIGR03435 family)